MSQETVLVEGRIVQVTGLAILISIDGNEVWLPKSQIVYGPQEYEIDDEVEIEITEWIAIEKDLA